ncbi:MAG: SDR family NAD(P)-dependent oxidoreductase, partial [Endozoicomonas sp.]|uniref:SDR family NAD(P)-dependent oxidoreductase n=1 Tax=Endozoicomonas sp. TaxID=1892382 RepID=UPI003D9B3AEC
ALPVKLMFFRIRENSLTASQENPAKLYDERCSTCALKFLYIEESIALLGKSNDRITVTACDILDEDQWPQLFNAVQKKIGCPDLIIHTAGVFQWLPAPEAEFSDWSDLLKINLEFPIALNHFFLSEMTRRRSGCLIHFGSIASLQPYPGGAAYCGSKFGLRGYCQALFEDVRDYRIKVCSIHPGQISQQKGEESLDKQAIEMNDILKTIDFILSVGHASCPTEITLQPQSSYFDKALRMNLSP